MKQRISMVALVGGLPALAVLGLVQFWPQVPPESALSTAAAPPARLVCYGYVDSRQGQLLLQPARAGRVSQVHIKEKQAVRKNTPLIQLDDELVKSQEQEAALAVQAARLQVTEATYGVKQYQARRAQAEAALEVANSKVLAAKHALAHKEELVRKHLLAPLEADMGRDLLSEAKALVKVEQNRLTELKAADPELAVELARLRLHRRQAQLEAARHEREQYLLRAPVDGLVLRVQAQEGDLVGPTSPRPAVWIVPAGAWVVRAEVPQEFAGSAEVGLDVEVEDEARACLLARGRIGEVSDWFLPRRQLSALPTGINTGLTLECVIDLQEGHAAVRLGQRVRVRILRDQPAESSKVSSTQP
jgi:multidrug resistance efflux pump